MRSARLHYRPVAPTSVDAFHSLVRDAHVRRYLLDGQLFSPEWSRERVQDSEALFVRRGVGIWLAYDSDSGDLVGFCGFLELAAVHPEPQLVYALFERFTGQGYATEMARAAIEAARAQPGFATLVAGVDEVNVASVRVLRKLGFERQSSQQGSFGNSLLMRLEGPLPRPG